MDDLGLRIFATALALIAAALGLWAFALRRRLHQSERRHEEAQRLRADSQRAATLGALTAGFAHEMKNSLTVVLGFAELARTVAERPAASGGLGAAQPDPKILRHLGDVENEARKTVSQLQAFLTYASGAPAPRTLRRVNELVNDALSMLRPIARMKDLVLDETLGEEGAIECDPFAVRQLLLNLMLNALAFAKSRITVSTTAGADGRVEVTIGNDGPDIPEEVRARVFERFVSDRPGGNGLGLAVAREIAGQHGGTLSLGEGPGTRFVARLPRAAGS